MALSGIRFAALPCLILMLMLSLAVQSWGQSSGPSRAGERPRPWEIHASQRYRTSGVLGNRQGSLAWHDSSVGAAGGAFLPALGLIRGGVEYVATRLSFGSPLRIDSGAFELSGQVEEYRLSAQVFTPWSKRWSSQLFGVVSSAFEPGVAPNEALSGASGVGMTHRFSDRLSAGFGALLLHQLDSQAVNFVPIVLLDWRVTERLTLRTREGVTLTYTIGARQRLLIAAVASFFQRRQFRLNESAEFPGEFPGGVLEIDGYAAGCRIIWRAAPGLTLAGTVEAPLDQNLRIHDRTGLKVVDVGVEGGLQLSVTARYRY